MAGLLTNIVSFFIMIPILGLFCTFVICKLITNHGKKSFHISVDFSTFLFILSVNFLSIAIWQKSFLWLILTFTLLILVIFTIVYWKIKKEIQIPKIIKSVWRLHFLIFSLLYFILILYGMIHRVFTNLFAF